MKMYESGETPEFVGRAVVALASDTSIQKKSGKVLLTGDLCKEYGFTDIDGMIHQKISFLDFSSLFCFLYLTCIF